MKKTTNINLKKNTSSYIKISVILFKTILKDKRPSRKT